jgi:hypothetical protein
MSDITPAPEPEAKAERIGFLPLVAALVPVGLVTALGLAAVWWHGVNS